MSKKYPGSEPPMTIGPYEPELGLDLKPDTRIADLEAENARLQDGYDSLKCQYDEEHDELLRYKALAERRREALSHMIAFFADGAQGDYRLLVREARAALAPGEEKE